MHVAILFEQSQRISYIVLVILAGLFYFVHRLGMQGGVFVDKTYQGVVFSALIKLVIQFRYKYRTCFAELHLTHIGKSF